MKAHKKKANCFWALSVIGLRQKEAGSRRQAGEEGNIVIKMLLARQFFSFQFAVFQLPRLTVLVASEAVKTEICISFVPPSPGRRDTASAPSPFAASALNHPLHVRHLFKHNCALYMRTGIGGKGKGGRQTSSYLSVAGNSKKNILFMSCGCSSCLARSNVKNLGLHITQTELPDAPNANKGGNYTHTRTTYILLMYVCVLAD